MSLTKKAISILGSLHGFDESVEGQAGAQLGDAGPRVGAVEEFGPEQGRLQQPAQQQLLDRLDVRARIAELRAGLPFDRLIETVE